MTGAPEQARSGIVLPVVLLLLLALGAAALAALVTARTELLLERGNIEYLVRRRAAEATLSAPIEATGELPPGLLSLGRGFLLQWAQIGDPGPSPATVRFLIHPDSLATALPGALEVGRAPVGGGVSPLSDCPVTGTGSRPLVHVRSSAPEPDPPLPDPPRLGLLGMSSLLDLARTELSTDGPFPLGPSPAPTRAPAGARVTGGRGSGLLLGAGDLTFAGDTSFEGLVMVAGDLRLTGRSVIVGVALVGGSVVLSSDARVFGCPARAENALRDVLSVEVRGVPGGALLGRF